MSHPPDMKPATNSSLHREHILAPITALAFFESIAGRTYVLAGEDTQLRIYEANTQRLCAELRVFAAQPVHGLFCERGNNVLIWGGASLTLLSRADVDRLLEGESVESPFEVEASDWIYDGALSPYDDSVGAVVTAHNEVVPVRVGPDGRSLVLGKLRYSPSRPILYSAKVSWVTEDVVLVAAGTVFGEIIVWKCLSTAGETPDEEECEVLFVLTGHEGSIFGVDISPETVPPTGETVRLLASCSDDRTIRVWDITEKVVSTANGDSANRFSEARETGFGGDQALDAQHSSKPAAVVMGHVSRIWQVKFSPPGLDSGNNLMVYSFGEDCTTQRWRLDLEGQGVLSALTDDRQANGDTQAYATSNTLIHEKTVQSHIGKHIWSAAVFSQDASSGQLLIATGGSDGKINLIGNTNDSGPSTTPDAENTESRTLTITASDILSSSSSCTPDAGAEPFHMYAFLSRTSVLATTASGRILIGTLNGEISWSEVPVPDDIRNELKRYQVVTSPDLGVALLGSASGQLYVYKSGRIRTLLKISGKIAKIIYLPPASFEAFKAPRTWASPCTIPVIVTVMGSAQARLLVVDPDSEALYTEIFDLQTGFTVTAAGTCQGYFIFGSRIGTISVFEEQSLGNFQQVARIGASSKDAVSSIIALPGKSDTPSAYFLTTSRDGKYRIYEIDTTSPDTLVHLRHEAAPPLGPMIEGAVFTDTPDGRKELILSGFRSKHFIVWNETRQQEMASVECGGAHRAFECNIHPQNPEQISFIWTKASRTCIYTQDRISHRPLKSGGHGHEIKTVASCWDYLASGAEDTAIRIWRYDSNGEAAERLQCLAVVEKHTAGIQSLKWAGNNYLLSSAGNEEFFIWRITRLDSDYECLAAVCEAAYPDRTRDGDLRIMSFDVRILPETNDVLVISMILSNSTLKTYRYSRPDGFKLLSQGRYTGACLTQIRHLRVCEGDMHVLTASTDGHLAVWKAKKSEYALVETAELHQSTVKALDLKRTSAEEHMSYTVVTGGDDNGIGHVQLTWDDIAKTFMIASRSLINGAHAAAITGIAITSLEKEEATLCTTSNDQRIKHWNMRIGTSGVTKMSLLANRYSSVADSGDLESLGSGERLVVVGVGMEVWKV